MNTFTVKPSGRWIVGQLVDIDMSKGGLMLPTAETRNLTVFMRVDDVGPDVVRAKVGEIIVYKVMNHIQTRDGQKVAVVYDDEKGENVVGKVEGLDMSKVTVGGQKIEASPIAVQ